MKLFTSTKKILINAYVRLLVIERKVDYPFQFMLPAIITVFFVQ